MANFLDPSLQQKSRMKRFGICDTPPPPAKPAYIDEKNGKDWLAVVENHYQEEIAFIPVDGCFNLLRPDGKKDKHCDGLLFHQKTIIFVELKDRNNRGWIKDGEEQLKRTIAHFEKTSDASTFETKKAYIANKAQPKFPIGQMQRMENFFLNTKYVLRMENRIKID